MTNSIENYLKYFSFKLFFLLFSFFKVPKVGGGFVDMERGYLFGERVGWFNLNILGSFMSPEFAQLVYVVLKISCYCVVMWYCQKIGYFWKV